MSSQVEHGRNTLSTSVLRWRLVDVVELPVRPRTGKTTVARLIGRYLYAHGVLPRDTFVERNALALKGLQQGWVDHRESFLMFNRGAKVSMIVVCKVEHGGAWWS